MQSARLKIVSPLPSVADRIVSGNNNCFSREIFLAAFGNSRRRSRKKARTGGSLRRDARLIVAARRTGIHYRSALRGPGTA